MFKGGYRQPLIPLNRVAIAVLTASLLLIGSDSHSAKLRPVVTGPATLRDWSDPEKRFLTFDYLHEFEVADEWLDFALNDREHRVSDIFEVPRGMKASVKFWMRVYTQYSKHHVLIFDDRHPEIIYEVMDFTTLAKTARNTIAYEIVRKRRIRKRLKQYRKAFKNLQRNPKSRGTLERLIRKKTRKSWHRHNYAVYRKNLRTQTGQRDAIIRGLFRADDFFPAMEQIFAEVGVPTEITRLSLVESSFNYQAVSRVGAAGVWQFMRTSGDEYLMIDYNLGIDERLSPLKSTIAASRLLKRNYRILKSWPLAIAAYNSGAGLYKRLERRHGKRSMKRLGHLFNGCKTKGPRVGWAGRNFFPGFLAILHAEKYRDIFFGKKRDDNVGELLFVQTKMPGTLKQLSAMHNQSLEVLHKLNPDVMNRSAVIPENYWLVITEKKPADLAVSHGHASEQ